MEKIVREDIQIIARHSNWSKKGIAETFEAHVHKGPADWNKFLKLFFLGLGVSFTVAGIIFFFAYNWVDLHKFFKLGLIAGLIIASVLTTLFSKVNPLVKNVLLTAAAILVGVLLAVFGQVYQTGANAYDLFLNWTLFIALWVFLVNYAPLWTVFITLMNITVFLYAEQVAHDWSDVFLYTLLFLVNTLVLSLFILGAKVLDTIGPPNWFTHLIALSAVTFATFGVVAAIFDKPETSFSILLLTMLLLYIAGIWHGLKTKSPFYISIISFSVIICFTAFLINLSVGAGMLLIISLFIITSVTILVKALINLNRKWSK